LKTTHTLAKSRDITVTYDSIYPVSKKTSLVLHW
jgi:hypothetical protein